MSQPESYYTTLGARFLRPARPALDQVTAWARQRYSGNDTLFATLLANAASLGEPLQVQELWEGLAADGLILMSWINDPKRSFCNQEPAPKVLCHSYPADLHQALLLASDVEGILTAEALAWEVAERLQAWGSTRPQKILWWSTQEHRERALTRLRLPLQAPWLGVFGALRALGVIPFSEEQQRANSERKATIRNAAKDQPAEALTALIKDVNLDFAWRYAAGQGYVVPQPKTSAQWPVGRAFSELPNPIEPLLEIWRLGYVLVLLREDALVLLSL